jgi:predicted small lipoprotein YifL
MPGTSRGRKRFSDDSNDAGRWFSIASFRARRLLWRKHMKVDAKVLWSAMLAATLSLGMAACEKKGPVEQAGEEVDEAIDTMKHGGKESTANKVDDAVDEAREGAEDAADELKKD